MKTIKIINAAILLVVFTIATLGLCVSSTAFSITLIDIINILSVILFAVGFYLFSKIYTNNLLPNRLQKLFDKLLKED